MALSLSMKLAVGSRLTEGRRGTMLTAEDFWSRRDSAAEVPEQMTKRVAWRLWWWTRRWASSRKGMRWPMPGLTSKATWASDSWAVMAMRKI